MDKMKSTKKKHYLSAEFKIHRGHFALATICAILECLIKYFERQKIKILGMQERKKISKVK